MGSFPRWTVVCALFFVIPTTACQEEFEPATRVKGLRVLAVQAEPAEARPDETVTLIPLVPDTATYPLTFRWSLCAFTFGALMAYECACPTWEVELVAESSAAQVGDSLSAQVLPTHLLALMAAMGNDPDCGGTLPIELAAASGDMDLGLDMKQIATVPFSLTAKLEIAESLPADGTARETPSDMLVAKSVPISIRTPNCVNEATADCGCTPAMVDRCEDGNPCTDDRCGPDYVCVWDPVPGCTSCTRDAGCDDGDNCTLDFCDPEAGRCQHPEIWPCGCESDEECDDGLLCTEDRCDHGDGPNRNPSIAMLRIDYRTWSADDSMVLEASQEVRLEPELEPGSRQPYLLRDLGRDPVERIEPAHYYWYATQGSFNKEVSYHDVPENHYKVPDEEDLESRSIDLWLVVRDARGGTDWIRRHILVPDPILVPEEGVGP